VRTAKKRQYIAAKKLFNNLEVGFMTDGRQKNEIETKNGEEYTVLHKLHCSMATK